MFSFFFFFNDTATTEIYTLSLHDALPIWVFGEVLTHSVDFADLYFQLTHQESWSLEDGMVRSEEHTSELQSRLHLVCRLLLEKKKQTHDFNHTRRRRN